MMDRLSSQIERPQNKNYKIEIISSKNHFGKNHNNTIQYIFDNDFVMNS